MEQRHRVIAEIALAAAGGYGLALAGGYAVRAHGIGHRLSEDVDLFTDSQRQAEFPKAVEAVVTALRERQFTVEVVAESETFIRLLVTMPGDTSDAGVEKLELAVDWRARPPVMMAVGPVLHPDDAVANKVCALYNRALARDFLDVDAAVVSGRYSRERLLELAQASDPGFDRIMFAYALGALTQITDTAFAEYEVPPDEISAMRHRFSDWRDKLTNQ